MHREELAAAYHAGYAAARAELRMLLAKVPEKQMIGVTMAWLTEEIDDGE